MLCKLDTVDVVTALYHFKLGARMRLGDHLVRSWDSDPFLLECLEGHDLDEQRHVRTLRRLLALLNAKGESLTRNDRPLPPDRIWRVVYSSRERLSTQRMLTHLLIDEAVARTLLGMIAGTSGLPLVRAAFDACSQDDVRHVEYLSLKAAQSFKLLGRLELMHLQSGAVIHVSRLQSALRPYIGSFAGVANSSAESVVSAVFGAASRVLGDLGPHWEKSTIMRAVHSADRSPWLLWLLR